MADFEGLRYDGESLRAAGDLMSSDFHACVFAGVTSADFAAHRKLRFFECRFESCDLSNLKVAGYLLRDCVFEGCKLVGVNWASAASVRDPAFRECKLDLSSFQGLHLRGLRCLDCSVKDADFLEADLAKADFSESQLLGTVFNKCDLSDADFRTAQGYFIDSRLVKIKGARFSYPAVTSLLAALGVKVEL